MIVREIKDDPTYLETFDYFNDYKDTRSWALFNAPELVKELDNGYTIWYNNWLNKLNDNNKSR